MSTTAPGPVHGTSWRRALPLMLAALLALGVVLALVQRNVLGVSVAYQGTTAKFATGRVSGENVGFGMRQITTRTSGGGTETRTVLGAGFATGTLDGFCLSQVQSLAPFGDVIIKVTAGDGDPATREIDAVNVQFDIAQLRGQGAGVNLDGMVHIGVSSDDLTTLAGVDNPLGAPTGIGWFGIDATKGDIHQARGYLHDAEIGGPMGLPNLSITVTPRAAGGTECWGSIGDATPLPH